MLIYRGAITAAEDRNWDDRSGLSPVELEVLEHLHGAKSLDEVNAAKHLLPTGVDPKTPAPAVVNYGRWLVPCPWCYSASMASRGDHRFYCVECNNGGSGKYAKVIWPDQADEMEAVLSMRPEPRTRNWAPPETLADLLAENESHGVM